MSLTLATTALADAPTSRIPVRLCRNVRSSDESVGIEAQGRFAREKTHVLASSRHVTQGLAFFTNGKDGAVGPAAWICDSVVGVDGSTVLRIHPPKPRGSEGASVVVETSGGGCVGCALALACGYFPAVRGLAVEWRMEFACSESAARGQVQGLTRTQLSERQVRFERRPGGEAARGALPLLGIAVFDVTADPHAARLSCRVEPSSRSVCRIAARAFVADYPP